MVVTMNDGDARSVQRADAGAIVAGASRLEAAGTNLGITTGSGELSLCVHVLRLCAAGWLSSAILVAAGSALSVARINV